MGQKSWNRAELLAERRRAEAPKHLDDVIEEARLLALESYRNLAPSAIQGLSRLAQETAASLAATHAAVSFVAESRVWFGGAFGFSRADAARANSFCDAVVRSAASLLVPDGSADPRFWQHEMVSAAPGLKSYAGVPLIDHGGYALGAVAVFSVEPDTFSRTNLQDLAALAVLVRDFLAESRRPHLVAAEPAPVPETGPVRRVQGWLGVKTLTTDEGRARTMAGLVVLSVARESPARRAGIRPTDILHSIGGRELFVPTDLLAAMAGLVAGSTVPIRLRRSGEWHQCEVEVRSKRRRLIGR
ncbi:MAG: PDZ domain-containing protein [Acetobacteraceae bacterium]|nr:PDZ domain-containing protein [Acetobacteraceae bacterium]